MFDTQTEHEGLRLFLSSHAYDRLVERIYGQTTRDVREDTRTLLRQAEFSTTKPDYGFDKDGDCWLIFDGAGIRFAMPCQATYNGRYGHHLIAVTVLTPYYKPRKPGVKENGRKKPKRKHLARRRGGKLKTA